MAERVIEIGLRFIVIVGGLAMAVFASVIVSLLLHEFFGIPFQTDEWDEDEEPY